MFKLCGAMHDMAPGRIKMEENEIDAARQTGEFFKCSFRKMEDTWKSVS